MITNQYKYILEDLNGQWEATPLGERGLNFEWSSPSDGRFDYTLKVTGKLIFVGYDYTRLKALEDGQSRCKKINVIIQRLKNNIWTNIHSNTLYISLTNGTWDLDRCTYEAQFDAPAKVAAINNSEDVDLFSIIPTEDRITVNTVPYIEQNQDSGYSIEYATFASITPVHAFPLGDDMEPLWQQPSNLPYNSLYQISAAAGGFKLHKIHIFEDFGPEVPETNDPRITICADNNHITQYEYVYMRWIKYIPSSNTIPFDAINLNEYRQSDGYRKIARLPNFGAWSQAENNSYGCVNDYYEIRYDYGMASTSSLDKDIDNGLFFHQILSKLLQPYGFLPKSNFFAIRADNSSYANINYVTGKKNYCSLIAMFQKSDVKRYDVTNNATVFKISIKNLLKWLVEMFNVRYGVIGNELIIEHVSYYTKGSLIDLTTNSGVNGTRKYTYSIDNIPGKEVFNFMDKRPDKDGQNDFNGLPILYNSECLNDDVKKQEVSHNVDKISTDIVYVIENRTSDKISDDGFVMVSIGPINASNKYPINASTPILSPVVQPNNVFGWALLHNDFWKDERPMNIGKMNGVDTNFNSIATKKADKIQIAFQNIEDFDPNSQVKTNLGTGAIESAKYNLSNKIMELKISYP